MAVLFAPGPYRLYLIYSGVVAFAFALAYAVVGVYRVEAAGLNPLQFVLVGTTLEVTYFAFNVPTGVVADTYSRRLSVLVGVGFWGAGLALEGAFPRFAAILLSQVVMGVGYTFVEGAIEAWLTDEIGEDRVGPALLRGGQVGGVAGFVGIFAAVGTASVRLALPLLIAGALFAVFAAYLAATMREPGFQRPPRHGGETSPGAPDRDRGPAWLLRTREAVREIGGTARDGARVVRHRPLALTIVAVAAIYGGHTEGFDRLWQAHFLGPIGLPDLGGLDPIVWFGVAEASATLLGVGAAEVLRRRLDPTQPAAAVRALFGLEVTMMAAVATFALAGGFGLALVAFLVASTARGLVTPVYTAWINRGVEPRVRATVLSLSAQADALGQFTVGPGLGAIGSLFGLRAALTAAGLALTPAVLLYGRARTRSGPGAPEPQLEPTERLPERLPEPMPERLPEQPELPSVPTP